MRKCCVPNCKSGYSSTLKNGLPKPHFFKMPKDPIRFAQWERRIKRDDRKLSHNDSVCSLHFEEHFILRNYKIILPDGTIRMEPRLQVGLSDDAEPTIFPNAPAYLSSRMRKRKSPKKRSAIDNSVQPKRRRLELEINTTDSEDQCNNETPSNVTNFDLLLQVQDFSLTKSNVNDVIASLALNHDENYIWIHYVLLEPVTIILLLLKDRETFKPTKRIIIESDLTVKVFFGDVRIKIEKYEKLRLADAANLIQVVENLGVCSNSSTDGFVSKKCIGFVTLGKNSKLCAVCNESCRHLRRKTIRKRKMQAKLKKRRVLVGKKFRYYRKKTVTLRTCMREMRRKFKSNAALNKLKNEIQHLPENQQESILACISAAKCRNKGMRYTRKFIYECILLKVKSRRQYRHMLKRKLLQLPSLSTISRYIRKLKSSFGFDDKLFTAMKKKSEKMIPEDKRGILLLDEMSLSSGLKFDKNDFKFIGFTDLSKYTPEHQKNELGDHALVLLYQPFRGSWLQPIASFLSKGAATGDVLVQIILEAVILIENSGFHVDGICCDGAKWNRSMMRQLGVTIDQPSCEHIVDPARRLWFISDFPHLVKTLWSWCVSVPQFETSDGTIKLAHWKALIEAEENVSLKSCPRLNNSHIKPSNLEKMNVGRAYQFFSKETSTAMELYKDHIPQLADSAPTQAFINRISDLIHAFSSSSPNGALRSSCAEKQAILEFVTYIKNNENKFMTKDCYFGFRLTCASILEMTEFLIKKCNYHYVMVSRFSQDNLEKFFGMLRGACGNGDHPDPAFFLLVYRLMSMYSLIKAPEGSNVLGDEVLEILIKPSDSENTETNNAKDEWERIKRNIVTRSEDYESFTEFQEFFSEDDDTSATSYPVEGPKFDILKHSVGYVAKKAAEFRECEACKATILVEKDDSSSKLTKLRDYFNVLKYPSAALVSLIHIIENKIDLETNHLKNESGGKRTLSADSFFNIIRSLDDIYILPRIGCKLHFSGLMTYVINFYVIFRLNILCEQEVKRLIKDKKNSRLRKSGKLN